MILFFGLLISCRSTSTTTYFSNCMLYGKSQVSLKLNLDKSFIYNFRYSDKAIIGKWEMNSNTLILTSDSFNEPIMDSLSQIIKTSDIKGEDKYLIKGNKLFIINQIGLKKDCYLKNGNVKRLVR